MKHVLKKIGLVAIATIGLSLAATPAFAAPADDAAPRDLTPYSAEEPVTFADAFNVFLEGGEALGYGAAAVVAGAYTGIATTPALIAHSFSCGADCE
jgi:hypothetical protein